jgi:hypothetical protein
VHRKGEACKTDKQKISVTNKIVVIKRKICPPPTHTLSKVLGANAQPRTWFQCRVSSKCSEVEVHSELQRLQIGPDWHRFWKRGLKLTIIETLKFVIKSYAYILLAPLNCNHILSIAKGPNKCP